MLYVAAACIGVGYLAFMAAHGVSHAVMRHWPRLTRYARVTLRMVPTALVAIASVAMILYIVTYAFLSI
jgi:hypothetical protein